METYPYPTPEGIIDLVRKSEYDWLKWDLEEQKAKYTADVAELNERLTKQHADMLDTIVKLRADLTRWQSMAERLATTGGWSAEPDSSWNEALAAYESAATATTGKPETTQ